MTLLLTLGFLCVLLMLVLSLAIATRADRRSAAAGVDQVRSRLAAESALGEAMARLRIDFVNNRYPADRFFQPDASCSWAGRQYLPCGGDTTSRAGLDTALAVQIAGRDLTPAGSLANDTGWIPLISKQTVLGADGTPTVVDAVVGRYSYLIIDQSGMIDPGAVVQRGIPESEPTGFTGASVSEISLSSLGFSSADRFCPDSPDEEAYGNLPTAAGRWFSLSHMVRGLNFTQSEMALANRTLFPFSHDQEQFWRDRDNSGTYSEGEEADRLDVCAFAELSLIYQTFVGPLQEYSDSAAGYDDCTWLKKLSDNPWFAAWKNQTFAGYSEPERTHRARSLVAAQVAANIADYADPDSVSTLAYLDASGQIHQGTSGSSASVAGVERTWALSQIAMRIEADATEAPTGGGGEVVTTGPTEADVPFQIDTGEVIPEVAYEATVTILGAQLSLHQYEGGPLMWWCPVTTNLKVGNDTIEPWGDIDTAASDIQDFNYPKNYTIPEVFPANTPIVVNGKFFNHPYKNSKYDTTKWECFRSLQSDQTSDHVKVLRDGDPVPNITTTSGVQNPVSYYLQEYVDGTDMSLQSNQAIYLFETRTSTQGHRDYQDLVVLVTLKRAAVQPPIAVTTFTATGTCNINPSNNADMEFFLTKPDGSQITRDGLLNSRNSLRYNGACTRIRFRPKGNSNDNYISLNGTRYDLQNGHLYEFAGSMTVNLFNDKYGSNGKAMGHWWLGLNCAAITVLDNGVTYTETVTPLPPTPPDPVTTMEPGEGSSLKLRAGFRVELSYPWSADAITTCPPSAVDVTYRVEAVTSAGKTLTRTATTTVTMNQSAVADSGTLLWSGDFAMDEWSTLEDAFNTTGTPALNTYTITAARIERVVVKDSLGLVADTVPSASEVLYEAAATSAVSGDNVYHVGATAVDPFMNDRGYRAADFGLFWSVYPTTFGTIATGSDTEPTGLGQIEAAYTSGSYAGICVPNSLVQRLGELGRVHSFQPNRSLRLWAATAADEGGHDADILDVFKIGTQAHAMGRVNINTLQPEVLKTLFTGALDVDVDDAVEAVLARRQGGRTFANVGEFLGGIADIAPGSGTLDTAAELAAVRLAEKLTVRPNYFTVILCAQAVKDVDGVTYRNAAGETVTASYGTFDVSGSGRYIDPVLAEQRMMAVVYRDGLTNATRLERLELLDE